MPFLGLVFVHNTVRERTGKPAGMRILHRAGSEQHEVIVIQTRHGQIAVKPPLLR